MVMRLYVGKHLQELRKKNQDKDLIIKQHKLHFITWLKDINLPVGKIEEEKMIHLLTSSPYSLFSRNNNELSESMMWRMSKNITNMTRCLSLWIQEG
jgi:hypothetical protein